MIRLWDLGKDRPIWINPRRILYIYELDPPSGKGAEINADGYSARVRETPEQIENIIRANRL